MNVELRECCLRLRSPLRTANGTITDRRVIGLRISDGAHAGLGEASPLPGWTEPYGRCLRELSGLDADRMQTHHLPRDRPAARHGVQLAMADLAARRVDTPLARYLRPDAPLSIPLNATIGAITESDAVAAACRAVRAGFPAVKCKVGTDSIDADVSRACAVREAIGDEVDLRLDANRAWTPGEASEGLDRLAAADPAYVEEPIRSPDRDTLASLAARDVPLAADETINADERSVRDLARAIDVVVIKPMSIGGLDRALSVARTARSHGLEPVISGTIDGIVGRTAAMHLAAAVTPDVPAGLATAGRIDDEPGYDPVTIEDGHAVLPATPGLGTSAPWDESEVRP